MTVFTRAEIKERLQAKLDKRLPIIMGGAGIGLVAKMCDLAGIDIIMAYNTGPFRMDGHGSLAGYLAYGDSNAITLDLARHILPVVKNTPSSVASAPLILQKHRRTHRRNAGHWLLRHHQRSHRGLVRWEIQKARDATGLGHSWEAERSRNAMPRMSSPCYVFNPEEAQAWRQPGCVVPTLV